MSCSSVPSAGRLQARAKRSVPGCHAFAEYASCLDLEPPDSGEDIAARTEPRRRQLGGSAGEAGQPGHRHRVDGGKPRRASAFDVDVEDRPTTRRRILPRSVRVLREAAMLRGQEPHRGKSRKPWSLSPGALRRRRVRRPVRPCAQRPPNRRAGGDAWLRRWAWRWPHRSVPLPRRSRWRLGEAYPEPRGPFPIRHRARRDDGEQDEGKKKKKKKKKKPYCSQNPKTPKPQNPFISLKHYIFIVCNRIKLNKYLGQISNNRCQRPFDFCVIYSWTFFFVLTYNRFFIY